MARDSHATVLNVPPLVRDIDAASALNTARDVPHGQATVSFLRTTMTTAYDSPQLAFYKVPEPFNEPTVRVAMSSRASLRTLTAFCSAEVVRRRL